MHTLVVSSQFGTDSRLLRSAAQRLGWQTLRLEGRELPEWFEPPDGNVAVFCPAPLAFDIADQLSHTLLGCNPDWTVDLEPSFLKREIRQMTLAAALELAGKSFVKHALSKTFAAGVYDAGALAEATSGLSPNSLVHVAEPVEWSIEYRCFVRDGDVAAISPYQRFGRILADNTDSLEATPAEVQEAQDFCLSVLSKVESGCPPGFVLDVGLIKDRGWAVVECNQCWAAGIYTCDPSAVLETLQRALVPSESMTDELGRWDFRQHYLRVCG